MKNITFLIVFIPIMTIGQAAIVNDIQANQQLIQLGLQLKSINTQVTSMNQNLKRLINVLEENNNLTSKSKDILKEELEAKKVAPDYVLKSTVVFSAMDLKNKILEAYKDSKESIKNFKNLDTKETEEFLSYAKNAVLKTTNLFKECKTILYTKSIIQPEERLKKIDGINTKLTAILDGFIAYNNKLGQLNSSRTIRRTLIDLNKN